ncbi:hypothetical protein COHA_008099 [Chlorella ohadii]|uniref:Uncharacterized protein n=1 Tax=Chlorella ohadii TaxID=2649997 RepID=A0AAD5DJG6_9CHLO|nr:hypothetical protein COHA_008099 [Chlorella ohadii]
MDDLMMLRMLHPDFEDEVRRPMEDRSVCLQQVEDRATRIQESLLQQLRRGQTDEDLRRAAILFGMGTGMVLVTRQGLLPVRGVKLFGMKAAIASSTLEQFDEAANAQKLEEGGDSRAKAKAAGGFLQAAARLVSSNTSLAHVFVERVLVSERVAVEVLRHLAGFARTMPPALLAFIRRCEPTSVSGQEGFDSACNRDNGRMHPGFCLDEEVEAFDPRSRAALAYAPVCGLSDPLLAEFFSSNLLTETEDPALAALAQTVAAAEPAGLAAKIGFGITRKLRELEAERRIGEPHATLLRTISSEPAADVEHVRKDEGERGTAAFDAARTLHECRSAHQAAKQMVVLVQAAVAGNAAAQRELAHISASNLAAPERMQGAITPSAT